jgi:predicted transposase/invertase (TIGR01784 family)
MELANKKPIYKDAWGEVVYLSRDESSRVLAEAREKARRDEEGRLKFGIQEGLRKGERKALRNVALRALKDNMSPEKIAELTDLSLGEIQRLAKSLKS